MRFAAFSDERDAMRLHAVRDLAGGADALLREPMRKQSDATKLRHARREEKTLRGLYSDAWVELTKRRHVGDFMSNILYNLKQDSTIPERYRTQFEEMQKAWDGIKRLDA